MSTISSLTVPLSDGRFMPDSSEARAVFVYEDGRRTDKPRTDAKGRPLYAMNGVLNSEVTGIVQGVRVLTPLKAWPEVPWGASVALSDAVVTISNARDSFYLNLTVTATGVQEV